MKYRDTYGKYRWLILEQVSMYRSEVEGRILRSGGGARLLSPYLKHSARLNCHIHSPWILQYVASTAPDSDVMYVQCVANTVVTVFEVRTSGMSLISEEWTQNQNGTGMYSTHRYK